MATDQKVRGSNPLRRAKRKALNLNGFKAFWFFMGAVKFVISGFGRTKCPIFRLISTLFSVWKGLIFCGRNTN